MRLLVTFDDSMFSAFDESKTNTSVLIMGHVPRFDENRILHTDGTGNPSLRSCTSLLAVLEMSG